jgi:hypothetical protein
MVRVEASPETQGRVRVDIRVAVRADVRVGVLVEGEAGEGAI